MIDAEREALIEKMARAIACHDAPNPKDCLASEWCEENWICYVPEATAAFAVAEAADCIDTIRTENEKLRSALKPFAWHVTTEVLFEDLPDEHVIERCGIKLGDLRAARAALEK